MSDDLSRLYFHGLYDSGEENGDSSAPILSCTESTIKLRQYLELRSKQLQSDLEAATLFKGMTEKGTIIEDAVRRFLKASLPGRYSIGLGEVVSPNNIPSYQTQPKDVIIFDSGYSPIK